jgi:hypothetical protein
MAGTSNMVPSSLLPPREHVAKSLKGTGGSERHTRNIIEGHLRSYACLARDRAPHAGPRRGNRRRGSNPPPPRLRRGGIGHLGPRSHPHRSRPTWPCLDRFAG